MDSPAAFRLLATGTPGTDTYVARGPRGSRATFDGFREGELLFVVPYAGLSGLDATARTEALRYYLSIALQQVWASSGSRIAWLFQSASDADVLRDDVISLVASQRKHFPEASIDIRVPEVSGLLGEQTSPGRRTVRAEELFAAAGELTDADLAPTMLLPLGRPLGYLDAQCERYGVEFGGRSRAIPAPAARIWLALRHRPADLGRPLGALDLERLPWPYEVTREDAVEDLTRQGLVVQAWAQDTTLGDQLSRLRLLPLRTFASDTSSPTGIVARARAARGLDHATTPVSQLIRDVLALGPTHDGLFDAIRAAWVEGATTERSTHRTADRIAEELLPLLAEDVAYLDAPAQSCAPNNVVDPARLTLTAGADTDLCVLPIGFQVDATDDVPTMVRVAARPEVLDADEGALWALVRDLDTLAPSGERQVQELLAAARERGLRNTEYALDRLEQRALVHRVRGPSALQDLRRVVFRPLLAGLSTTEMLSRSGPAPLRSLGAARDGSGRPQHGITQIDIVATALWGSAGAELPTLAHAVALLFPPGGDLGAVRFVLDRIRDLVRDGAAYLDALEADPTGTGATP